MRRSLNPLLRWWALLSAMALASCGGSEIGSPASRAPANASGMRAQSETGSSFCPCLYVTNYLGTPSVTVYASSATGNVKPIQQITGSNTGLSSPEDLAVDGSGNIYVANGGFNTATASVTVYAAGATGDATPIQTISGSNTGLSGPSGIALDPVNGNIYVANGVGQVSIFAPGSNGNVAPLGVISGPSTGLALPAGLTLDASGNVYVPNLSSDSITIYSSGSTGNVAPTRTIVGNRTKIDYPFQLALDASLNIYSSNYYISNRAQSGPITVYAAGAHGNVRPIAKIRGARNYPHGVALDSSNNIYSANFGASTITVYAAGSNGKVPPMNTIGGSNTGLDGPMGIVIR